GRSLWERYDNGDNLLFRQSDLQAPAESPAFKELLTIGDAQARTLVQELYRACQGPLDVVPLLTDLMPEEKPAGKATKTASVSSSAVAQQPAAAQGPDWDFGDEKAGEATVKKPAGDKIPAGGKIPAWAWGALGGAAAVVLLSVGVGVGLFLHKGSAEKNGTPSAQLKPEPKKSRPQPNDNPAPRPNEFQANLVNEDKKPPQIPASPIPPLQDAVLLMNFDKDTFYQKDGKTYVRDLSGHGNDGLCENVAFTPEGKAGGGLACNGGYLRLRRSLINRLPNYTLMAWIRVEDAQGSDRWIYARTMDQLKNSNYALGTDGGGGLGVAAWNQDHQPDFWVNASPNQSVITKDQWVFVAARLRNGGTSQGDLRLIVDDRPYDLHSQMVKGPEEGTYDFLGVNLKAVLDEVVLCPRSLSDSEIQAIRRQGIEGKSLRPPTRPLLADQTPLADFPRRSWIFQLSPAGDMLAISDEGSKVWRLEEPSTKKLIREFHGHEGAVEAVAFSADGRRAVTSGADKMLRLWDVQTGKMIGTRKVFRGPVVDIALSSDGKKAATAHGTPDADMWNFEENTGGGYHNNRKAVSVAFSPDGRYLACGYDESDKEQDTLLFLWPLFKNGNVLTFRGPAKAVKCIAFSPDGKYIAAGQATPDSVVSLWEMATRRSVRQYRMSKNPIHRLAFSPDSRFLLTSMENRYQVWQVEATGRSVLGGGNIDQDLVTAAFTPDSRG
ncbi:MAG TPA: LamG-like jellyroll fold domain-containing protein, partial [Gemmataceae bacterium]